ncbi:MAG: 23S rRNA (guanosine(2251)-2'-O)-methyltransferase RlmB [Thermoplasmata archaeon]
MNDDLQHIEGKNEVLEALRAGRSIIKILLATSVERDCTINEIFKLASANKIRIDQVDRREIDHIAKIKTHQGIIAFSKMYTYSTVDEILNSARSKNEEPFILILDGIEDPQNFGAILRSAEASGVHGVIIPDREAVGVTPGVIKASAGAVEYVKIAQVTNLTKTVEILKKQEIWICGATMEADKEYYNSNLTGPIAIIIGSEGYGIRRLLKERCDFLVKIPMKGRMSSLNASVTAAILLYEKVRQENFSRKVLSSTTIHQR